MSHSNSLSSPRFSVLVSHVYNHLHLVLSAQSFDASIILFLLLCNVIPLIVSLYLAWFLFVSCAPCSSISTSTFIVCLLSSSVPVDSSTSSVSCGFNHNLVWRCWAYVQYSFPYLAFCLASVTLILVVLAQFLSAFLVSKFTSSVLLLVTPVSCTIA